jgi:hypothetical protein
MLTPEVLDSLFPITQYAFRRRIFLYQPEEGLVLLFKKEQLANGKFVTTPQSDRIITKMYPMAPPNYSQVTDIETETSNNTKPEPKHAQLKRIAYKIKPKKLAYKLIPQKVTLPSNAYKYLRCSDLSSDGYDTFAELTRGSIDKMINYLVKETKLSENDVFLDGGCASNCVACHVADLVNCRAWGIEYIVNRVYTASNAYLKGFREGAFHNTKVGYIREDLASFQHFGETTYAFFFDEAFNEDLVNHCVQAAANTPSLRYYITFKQSKTRSVAFTFRDNGFKLIDKMKVSKAISGESNTIYIYQKESKVSVPTHLDFEIREHLNAVWYGTSGDRQFQYHRLFIKSSNDMEKSERLQDKDSM